METTNTNTNGTSSSALFNRLNNEISRLESKTISLGRLFSVAQSIDDNMLVYLQSPEGQALFQHCLKKLVSEQIISPVGKKPHTVQGLHLKYKLHNDSGKKDSTLATDIIRSITPPAAVDYYLKNPQDYWKDREVIAAICNFLQQKNIEPVTVNERAYQLFGDEKSFKREGRNRSRGETVLKRLGLNYASIGCQESLEPFFSFQNKEFNSLTARDIYIIENKDTFWSFKRTIMDVSSRIKADMLVYGEGRKIISSFRFMAEYGIDPQRDRLLYFGDLDPEGINIYCELLDEYPQYIICPFAEGYQAVWEIGREREPVKTPKEQRIKKDCIEKFIRALETASGGAFDPSNDIMLKKHLEGGYCIPQEALSAVEMKERFGTND